MTWLGPCGFWIRALTCTVKNPGQNVLLFWPQNFNQAAELTHIKVKVYFYI